MLVLSLPFRGPDELIHFYKAYSISEGNVLCQVKVPPGAAKRSGPDSKWVGNEIPHTLQVTADRTVQKIKLPMPSGAIASAFNVPMRSSPRAFVNYSGWSSIAMYSPVGYAPQVAGILLGRIFSLSPILLMYLARLFNLLVFILLVSLAIRWTPVGKWTMVLVAVMPLTINLAASVSADAVAISLSFLFIAGVLKMAHQQPASRLGGRQLGLLALLAFLLALSKPPYFLLVFLLLLIPAKRLGGRGKYAAVFGGMLAGTVAVAAGWDLLVRNVYVGRLASVSPSLQISYILHNPPRFAWIMLRTAYTYKTFWPKTFVGGIGFLEVNLPVIFLALYLLALVAVALLEPVDRTPDLREKGVSLGVFLGITVVTLATFYITWTPVGQRLIDGFQARYFIPIVPLLLLVLANGRLSLKRDWIVPVSVLAFSGVSILITMVYMVRVYY